MDTQRPRAFSTRPMEAAVTPLPTLLMTPPVQKMYLRITLLTLTIVVGRVAQSAVLPTDSYTQPLFMTGSPKQHHSRIGVALTSMRQSTTDNHITRA